MEELERLAKAWRDAYAWAEAETAAADEAAHKEAVALDRFIYGEE